QPNVLDGDHRLVGEGCHKFNLLIGKRLNLAPTNRNHSDENLFPEHRDRKYCSVSSESLPVDVLVLGVRQDVGTVNSSPFNRAPSPATVYPSAFPVMLFRPGRIAFRSLKFFQSGVPPYMAPSRQNSPSNL